MQNNVVIRASAERKAEIKALSAGYLDTLWPSGDARSSPADERRLFFVGDALCELTAAFSGQSDARELAEAVVVLTRCLACIPADEWMRIATRVDAAAYLESITLFAEQVEKDGRLSPLDLEAGTSLARLKAFRIQNAGRQV